MYNDHDKNNQLKYKKRNIQRALQSLTSDTSKQQMVSMQIPPNRRQEILEYLKLFGYKSEKTILQVHIIGFFSKRRLNQRELEKKQKQLKDIEELPL